MPAAAAWPGPSGSRRRKFDVSMAIGERVLLPAVRSAPADTLIVSDGFSCREQIAQATGRKAATPGGSDSAGGSGRSSVRL